MRFLFLAAAMASFASAQTNETGVAGTHETITVRVTGDRVSLRAEPDLDGYLLDRAMRDDELVFQAQTNGWVGVQPPPNLDLWVAAEYVQDGVVVPDLLNVRAGPNLNYAKVGELSRGDKVEIRGEFNEWLRIAPPAVCRVWISEAYVAFPKPPQPNVEPESGPDLVEGGETNTETVTNLQATAGVEPKQEELPPLILVMDDSREQGAQVEMTGVLRRANPGLYKLVLIEGAVEEPVCLVRGQQAQMERYLNRTMSIEGKRYWARDVALPVVQPDRIHLDPILE